MYVFQEIYDSQLMLFLFFPPPRLLLLLYHIPTGTLPVNFTISIQSFPIPQSFQLCTFNAAFEFVIELKPIDCDSI